MPIHYDPTRVIIACVMSVLKMNKEKRRAQEGGKMKERDKSCKYCAGRRLDLDLCFTFTR